MDEDDGEAACETACADGRACLHGRSVRPGVAGAANWCGAHSAPSATVVFARAAECDARRCVARRCAFGLAELALCVARENG